MSKASSAEVLLKKLRKLPENMNCPNCNTPAAQGIGFGNVCVKFKTFVCDMCKTSHQAISHRVKSVSMSTWTLEEVKELLDENVGGNNAARHVWLLNAPAFGVKYDGGVRPKEGHKIDYFKQFIVDCYEYGKFKALSPYIPSKSNSFVTEVESIPLSVSAPRQRKPVDTSNELLTAKPLSKVGAKNNCVAPLVDLLDSTATSVDISSLNVSVSNSQSCIFDPFLPTVPIQNQFVAEIENSSKDNVFEAFVSPSTSNRFDDLLTSQLPDSEFGNFLEVNTTSHLSQVSSFDSSNVTSQPVSAVTSPGVFDPFANNGLLVPTIVSNSNVSSNQIGSFSGDSVKCTNSLSSSNNNDFFENLVRNNNAPVPLPLSASTSSSNLIYPTYSNNISNLTAKSNVNFSVGTNSLVHQASPMRSSSLPPMNNAGNIPPMNSSRNPNFNTISNMTNITNMTNMNPNLLRNSSNQNIVGNNNAQMGVFDFIDAELRTAKYNGK